MIADEHPEAEEGVDEEEGEEEDDFELDDEELIVSVGLLTYTDLGIVVSLQGW